MLRYYTPVITVADGVIRGYPRRSIGRSAQLLDLGGQALQGCGLRAATYLLETFSTGIPPTCAPQ